MNATIYNKHGVFNLEGLTTSTTKSVGTFTKLSNAFKVYNGNLSKSTQLQTAYIKAVGNQNHALGNYLAGLNGAKASMGGYIKSLIGAKAATIGLQVASVALNATITMGISLAISALVTQIQKWANAQEDARKKSVELTNSYKEQQSSLESQIEKYKELKDTLDDGNLSTDEARSIKEQLLEIQQSLIESYGDEASNIDLVNGKYREQLGLLGELSKEKATEYVTENRDVFADAKEALEKERTYNLGTVTSWNNYSPQTEDQKKLLDYIEAYSELLDLTYTGATGRGVSATSVSVSVKADVTSADELMHQFATDLEKYGEENDIDVSGILEGISGQLKETWTDELTEYKTVYDEFMKAEIVRNDTLRPLYQESIQAVEDYNKALSTGEGIEEAKANLESVQQSVQSATGELEGSQGVFDGIYEGINKDAEAAYNLGKAFENDKTVQSYAEQLRGLTDIDLKAINFDNDNTEKGEEAFKGLMETLGLTEEQVQSLINKLVELGYVQGEVQGSILDNKNDVSFLSIFDSSDFEDTKQSLLELAKAGELTNKALSSDDYSEFIDKLESIGISADEAKDEILSLLDATEKLSGASQTISSLEDAYTEFQEKGFVLAETIESIPDAFRQLESYDFNLFEKIIGNPSSTTEQIQQAFNDLVTAYINEQSTLADMSEAETQQFIANMKEMGIVNAEEVVNATVAFKNSMKETEKEAESTAKKINEFLVNVKGKAASATNDLTNCTWSEINALIEEGNKFGYTTSKIEEFAMQKLYANRQNLDVSDDIAGLVMLAETLGLCSEAVVAYKKTVALANQGYGGGYAQAEAEAKNIAQNLKKEIAALYSPKYSTPTYKPTSSSSSSSSSSKEAEKTAEEIDWIEKLLERIQSRIDKLDKTASSTYRAWSTRNKALLDELKEVNGEIKAQQKAYEAYMAKANSVGLSEHYKQLVQNGDYKIEDITDATLKDQISSYEEWYNKAMDCSDAIEDLKDNILELTTTQFENVFNEYEDSLSGYRHQIEMLETYIDQTEAKGYVVSGNYYKQLIETEKLNIKMLQDEYAKLKDSLQLSVDTGKIIAYSDAWYDMVDSIRGVQKSIEDANTSLIEYQTTLRELEWESFDRFMDKISKIKDESDFLIELMSDKDMFNEDGITDEGQATLGLHAINYNVYLSKAEEYAKELKDINEEIANDPNNQTLLERRQELLELQQESILASKDEQQAMKDLISEGYDVFIDSLQKIIDKRKEMLSQMKDIYDYEKSISEQTKEISKIEKMLKAYEGDSSEEAKKKVQQYKVSLEEAKSNLEQTEFDRYIKDTEDMLDSLMEDAQEFVDSRLSDMEQLVSEVIDSTNKNASDINSTIKDSADDVGYTISSKLSNALTSASNGVADLVSNYNDNFLETMTTLQTTVDDIRSLIAGESNSDNLNNGDKYNSDEKEYSSPQDRWTKDENNNWNYYENGEQVKDAWTKYEKDDKWYHLGDSGVMDTNTWTKNKSGTWSYVDETGAAVTGWHKLDWQGKQDWYNFDNEGNMLENQWIDDYFVAKSGKMLTNTWIGHNGKYYWVGEDGKWLDKSGWTMDTKPLDGLPLYEYAKGSRRIPKDQLAWTQEEGTEIIRRASDNALLTPLGQNDMVFTNEATQRLWEFSQDPQGYMSKIGLPNLASNFSMNIPSVSDIKFPEIKRTAPNQNVSIGDINLYGVNDPQEFAQQVKGIINNALARDNKTRSIVRESVLAEPLGRTDRSYFYR